MKASILMRCADCVTSDSFVLTYEYSLLCCFHSDILGGLRVLLCLLLLHAKHGSVLLAHHVWRGLDYIVQLGHDLLYVDVLNEQT